MQQWYGNLFTSTVNISVDTLSSPQPPMEPTAPSSAAQADPNSEVEPGEIREGERGPASANPDATADTNPTANPGPTHASGATGATGTPHGSDSESSELANLEPDLELRRAATLKDLGYYI
jgi:hypothetical protein